MADGKRGLRAKWRERRTRRAEQAAQKVDGRVRVKQARVVGGDGGRGRLVIHFANWRRAMMGHGDCAGIGVPVWLVP